MRPSQRGALAKRYCAVEARTAVALLGEGVDAELVGERKVLELGDDVGDARREVTGEVLDVMQDGRQAGDEEERERDEDGENKRYDRDGARGRPLADPDVA